MPALPASWQAMPACVDPLAVLRTAQDIHPTHDLIVLEADAVLPDGWWPRLMSEVGAGDGFDVISTLGSRHSALVPFAHDRKSVVEGKSVSVRVGVGSRRISKKKIHSNDPRNHNKITHK